MLKDDFVRRMKLLGRTQLVIATDKGYLYYPILCYLCYHSQPPMNKKHKTRRIVHTCELPDDESSDLEWRYLYHNPRGGLFESLEASPKEKTVALGTTSGFVSVVSVDSLFPVSTYLFLLLVYHFSH